MRERQKASVGTSVVQAEPAPTPEASSWQPIETAPRDGTEIVLTFYSDWSERWLFWVDYWRKYLTKDEGGFGGEGWGGTAGHPTHWAPLPCLDGVIREA